ncbi:hydrogenase maturation protease [Paludibaculum fermentans]|uniref:hydrogenase maturation protease n=1 Tax=Paludibaculum fermentans TaxID=1473598 RepID=UPI003EC0096C
MTTLIAGLGNVLMGDDAIGPTLIYYLRAFYEFPPEVELKDFGTPGIDLAQHLANRDTVILVDASEDPASAPGTVKVVDPAGLPAAREFPRHDLHAPDWHESLQLSRLHGVPPRRLILIGVAAGSCQLGEPMSPEISAHLETILDEVAAVISGLGIALVRRAAPQPPELWWQR